MIRATSVYLPAEIGGAARNTALGYDGGMKYALLILATTALGAQGLKFDFVSDKSAPGFQKALPGAMYSDETGYGFEDAAKQPPFYFSIRVPEEGNYRHGEKFYPAGGDKGSSGRGAYRGYARSATPASRRSL